MWFVIQIGVCRLLAGQWQAEDVAGAEGLEDGRAGVQQMAGGVGERGASGEDDRFSVVIRTGGCCGVGECVAYFGQDADCEPRRHDACAIVDNHNHCRVFRCPEETVERDSEKSGTALAEHTGNWDLLP